METNAKSEARWRDRRRVLVGVAIFATVVGIFYAEENWRGLRDWERCKSEREAKGMNYDWAALTPPLVPDDQNFFKAPMMAEWFVKSDVFRPLFTNLTAIFSGKPWTLGDAAKEIPTTTEAREFLTWSEGASPELELMRRAVQRPYARMDGDYSEPIAQPVPNFVAIRTASQMLAKRSYCHLLLGEPDKALRELTLLHNLRRILEGAPTGKPMTLVAAMINVAVSGLYANAVAEGLRLNAWREPQLAELEQQLDEINLLPVVATAFRCEQVASARFIETLPRVEICKMLEPETASQSTAYWFARYAPRGWFYQNMVSQAQLGQPYLDAIDLTNQTISPRNLDDQGRAMQNAIQKRFRYNFLTSLSMPNFVRALQTFARNQNYVREAAIACALERHRLARGEYPQSLDAMAPQFMGKLPQDILGGPLKYRRLEKDKFLLYSIGWNATDDGGGNVLNKQGALDLTQGDWAWPPVL